MQRSSKSAWIHRHIELSTQRSINDTVMFCGTCITAEAQILMYAHARTRKSSLTYAHHSLTHSHTQMHFQISSLSCTTLVSRSCLMEQRYLTRRLSLMTMLLLLLHVKPTDMTWVIFSVSMAWGGLTILPFFNPPSRHFQPLCCVFSFT